MRWKQADHEEVLLHRKDTNIKMFGITLCGRIPHETGIPGARTAKIVIIFPDHPVTCLECLAK